MQDILLALTITCIGLVSANEVSQPRILTNICSGLPLNALVPDVNDCSRYFYCPSSGIPNSGHCGQNMFFNSTSNSCTNAAPRCFECPRNQYFIDLPVDYQCIQFVRCFAGRAQQRTCADGLSFDPVKRQCNFSRDVTCPCPAVDIPARPLFVRDTSDCSNRNATYTTVELQREQLEYNWTRFCTAHQRILDVCGPATIEFENAELNTIQPVYDECKSILSRLAAEDDPDPNVSVQQSRNTPIMTEVDQLHKEQETAVNHMRRIKEWATRADAANPPPQDRVQQRLDYLQDQWNAWHSAYDKLILHLGDDVDDNSNEIDDMFFDIKGKLRSFSELGARHGIHHLNDNNHVASTRPEFRLPTLELPKFSGGYAEWTSFRDRFQSMIAMDQRLSSVHKMHYLKSCVSGEAEKMIRSYPITANNFQHAWDALANRYDNTRLIVNTHIQAIVDCAIVRSESAQNLRKLMDTINENVCILQGLNVEVNSWDPILIFLLTKKIDVESHRQWELSRHTPELPTLSQFRMFIEQRCRALEAVDSGNRKSIITVPTKTPVVPARNPFSDFNQNSFHVSQSVSCPQCRQQHKIYSCPSFLMMTVSDRKKRITELRLCFNCLAADHQASTCTKGPCRLCGERHHTFIHTDRIAGNQIEEEVGVASLVGVEPSIHPTILLATARVLIQSAEGQLVPLRALLDMGSQCSFITERGAQRLRLSRTAAAIPVSGLGQSKAGRASGIVTIKLHSAVTTSFIMEVRMLTIRHITSNLPNVRVPRDVTQQFQHLELADPDFHTPDKVDILFGADVFGCLLSEGFKYNHGQGPHAINTQLGWVIFGPIFNLDKSDRVQALLTVADQDEMNNLFKKFWETEQVPETPNRSNDDQTSETIYEATTIRTASGRYQVKLPFKPEVQELGKSRGNAIRSMVALEKRFKQTPELKKKYIEFMRTYKLLNHMEPVHEPPIRQSFYLPHLPVITEKMRVVFDASRKTTSGKSLNDQLLVGPRLQDDLITIVMRFRSRKIAMTSDIVKMYRQILIAEEHLDFQRIVWRERETEPMLEYRLNTVTYGTSSAPYLAIRTLHQLSTDEEQHHPEAAHILRTDFYVDDLMTGCDNPEQAVYLQQQLTELLKRGGFELRKWSSNESTVLASIPVEHQEEQSCVEFGGESYVKTLGLFWCPAADEIRFKMCLPIQEKTITKRNILSEVSKLFDPLGLLSPVIIMAKIYLQQLWTRGVDWDEELATDITESWKKYRLDLLNISNIKVPRWIGTLSQSTENTQLHGFCDASEKAYCAVVYSRCVQENGTISTSLIAAKTKVAPLKSLTIPRLELCGAQLLAKLMHTIKTTLDMQNTRTVLWTDSQVVLWYLTKNPTHLKTFVRHRVIDITSRSGNAEWKHVPTRDNPADCGSRGLMPSLLIDHQLWWTGPQWLKKGSDEWPTKVIIHKPNISELEEYPEAIALVGIAGTKVDTWYHKYSKLLKLIRITAYLLRFGHNCTKKDSAARRHGTLTVAELDRALEKCIAFAQRTEYADEYKACATGNSVAGNSQLASLVPFMDKNGILRVRGRLINSTLSTDQIHPIILPAKNVVTSLIIKEAHLRSQHAGIQLTLLTLRQKYWIITARREAAKTIHGCLRCFRWRQRNRQQQMMGDLPKSRVSPTRPFLITGVDYAGPILIKSNSLRNARIQKAYIAIFVCFSTKAAHLEVVSDLSTPSFMNALQRFIARRGRCVELHSDCGTNFVGANTELNQLRQEISTQLNHSDTQTSLANEGITWKFIPPGSPTFGGLWEAAVKSAKHHMRRIIGETKLTFEALTTVSAQIEACLNSRPLCAMSSDVDDLMPLTPGHFLIGEPLIAVPTPEYSQLPKNRLSHWQHLQQITQHFWSRWRDEYIASLQQRAKWRKNASNLKAGDLVLVSDERLPPTKWPLGRVTEVFPGEDGQVRVAAIKTNKAIIRRNVRKVCLLPHAESDQEL